ncbi:MAG: hypothetical protein WA902_12705 [Thermosynechococcaceae cyanobacterium]
MASITIRNLDEQVKTALRLQAAQHNRSMEEEARIILRQTLCKSAAPNITELATLLFGEENGFDLDSHPPISPRNLIE